MMKKRIWILCWAWLVGLCAYAGKPCVHEHVLLYPSVDQHGDSLTLSGKLTVPADKPAKGIILIPHYTISSNDEAPSNKLTGDAKYFQDEYVLLVPDFIGYGATRDRVHPYLHGELTARNCVDMYLGALPMLDSLALNIPVDSIYLVGFSQGGATAMWILKLIEEQYADKIHVIKCFAGGGPYDVAVTYDHALATNHVFLPLVIPMLVLGTDAAYDLHLNRVDFFTPKMEKAYKKYIEDKKHGIASIYFSLPNHKVSHWLTKEGMDKSNPQTQRLYDGLIRSSLVHDTLCPSWTPQTPLYVFHSTKDNVVTIQCAEQLRRCFPDLPNVTYDFGNYGSHMKASYIFYRRVRDLLD